METISVNKVVNEIKQCVLGERVFSAEKTQIDEWLYPLDLDFTMQAEDLYYSPKDEVGIPVKIYQSIGKQYNPSRVAAYGFSNWNLYRKTGSQQYIDSFRRVSKWFSSSSDGIWHYDFDWEDIKAPWISCLAQGQGVSILSRAYLLDKDPHYLDIARRALSPFFHEIAQKGIRSALESGSVFFEEYPGNCTKHVLNGFMYAAIGVCDLVRICGDPTGRQLLYDMKETLEKNILQWDLGYWSAYDLTRTVQQQSCNPCTAQYHSLHIAQLQYLAHELDSELLHNVALRWDSYFKTVTNRIRAISGKISYRLRYPAQC
ncbi:MAG TPA: D-glucuronyl C5-epimerase family protein [Patescibacteria group bacterium]|nr:D-glucuronyl C5-epimerase family protein [Patescibacteria group bacterium]